MPFGFGEVRFELLSVHAGDECRLIDVQAPRGIEPAGRDRIKPELFVDAARGCGGVLVVGGVGQSPSVLSTRRSSVREDLRSVDVVERAGDETARQVRLDEPGDSQAAGVDLLVGAVTLTEVVACGEHNLADERLDGNVLKPGQRDREDRKVSRVSSIGGGGCADVRSELVDEA